MGMGFVLAQQMGGMMGNTQASPQQAAQPVGGAVPPPMPTQTLYYYASNGVQHGPVTFEQMQSLFASRAINRDSLVWKQGMAAWASLKEVEELKSFLGGNTPPPLPTE
jgi:hypothetical protein